MEEHLNYLLSDAEKNALIDELTPELQLLRTKADISQEEIANIIGTSRQTYGAIERKSRRMTWNTYLSLIMFYSFNNATHDMIKKMKAFPHDILKRFNGNAEPPEFDLGLLFQDNISDIINSLDEQALSTIRTIMMIEYSRCNNVSAESAIKFFEGIHFRAPEITDKDRNTKKALNKIKKDFRHV